MNRPILALLLFAFLFLKNATAQDHFFSGSIRLAVTSKKVDGSTNLGGNAYLFPSIETGWELREKTWLGFRAEIALSAGVGADYFFKKRWAVTSRLGSGGLEYIYEKKDLTTGKQTLRGFSFDLGLSTLVYGLGLRYFW